MRSFTALRTTELPRRYRDVVGAQAFLEIGDRLVGAALVAVVDGAEDVEVRRHAALGAGAADVARGERAELVAIGPVVGLCQGTRRKRRKQREHNVTLHRRPNVAAG